MKTRKEAAALVMRQLKDSPGWSGTHNGKTPIDGRDKGGQHHYGKQELRELLDFIYGGPPTNESERIA